MRLAVPNLSRGDKKYEFGFRCWNKKSYKIHGAGSCLGQLPQSGGLFCLRVSQPHSAERVHHPSSDAPTSPPPQKCHLLTEIVAPNQTTDVCNKEQAQTHKWNPEVTWYSLFRAVHRGHHEGPWWTDWAWHALSPPCPASQSPVS